MDTAEMIAAVEAAYPMNYEPPFSVEYQDFLTEPSFVVMDNNGDIIAECDRERDARLIAAMLNGAPGIVAAAERMLASATQLPYVHEATASDMARALLAPLYDALVATGAILSESPQTDNTPTNTIAADNTEVQDG